MDNNIVQFGKHKGERWTRLPISYLKWLINAETNYADKAREELKRRGTILTHEIKFLGHAIDRFYQRYGKAHIRRPYIIKQGGIYSCLYKFAEKALEIADGKEKVKYKNLKFVFKYQELTTTLITVM